MATKKQTGYLRRPGRGSLSSPHTSSLAQRSTIYPEDHDTTIKTRALLIERGYIKPGDSQYDAKLDPVAVARKASRALSRETRKAVLAAVAAQAQVSVDNPSHGDKAEPHTKG